AGELQAVTPSPSEAVRTAPRRGILAPQAEGPPAAPDRRGGQPRGDQPAARSDQADVQVGGGRGAASRIDLPGSARRRGAKGRSIRGEGDGTRPARSGRARRGRLAVPVEPPPGDDPNPAADRDAARGGGPDEGPGSRNVR